MEVPEAEDFLQVVEDIVFSLKCKTKEKTKEKTKKKTKDKKLRIMKRTWI